MNIEKVASQFNVISEQDSRYNSRLLNSNSEVNSKQNNHIEKNKKKGEKYLGDNLETKKSKIKLQQNDESEKNLEKPK